MLTDLVFVAAGIALLFYGGEQLVSGSANLGRSFGLSRLVIGLTVVAFGTSAPELAASIMAAVFRDAPEIALSNVIGSNIANIGLILGFAAILAPMYASKPFLRREVPIMIGVSGLLWLAVAIQALNRATGALFVLLLVGFLWILFVSGREVELEGVDESTPPPPVLASVARVVLGVGLLVIGARILIDGAIGLAEALGISQRVIGLTMVAIGTSLPELATVIVAAIRRESDMILGNLIGSNIFNVLCILGITLLIQPFDIRYEEVRLDLWVMMGFALAIWPLLQFRMRIGRKRGTTLLVAYVVYIALLFV